MRDDVGQEPITAHEITGIAGARSNQEALSLMRNEKISKYKNQRQKR